MVTVRGDLEPDVPPRLYQGPEVDGCPTWLCHYADVPAAGYEMRFQSAGAFVPRDSHRWPPIAGDELRWVQVRRRLPQPGDVVYVNTPNSGMVAGQPVMFAQVCEAVVGAMPARELIPGEDYAEPEHSVAMAVWHLLTG